MIEPSAKRSRRARPASPEIVRMQQDAITVNAREASSDTAWHQRCTRGRFRVSGGGGGLSELERRQRALWAVGRCSERSAARLADSDVGGADHGRCGVPVVHRSRSGRRVGRSCCAAASCRLAPEAMAAAGAR